MIEIENKLFQIFKKRTKIDFEAHKELQNKNVFDVEINLQPRELVYILYDIEKEFNIKVPDHYLINKKFCSFEMIEKIVKKEL